MMFLIDLKGDKRYYGKSRGYGENVYGQNLGNNGEYKET